MTATAVRIGAQRPRLSALPAARRGSSGPDAVEFAAHCGLELDDWQAWALDGLLSEDAAGRLCAKTALLLVPRQNGKNAILEAYELFCFYVLGYKRILHTAQLGVTSAEHQQRMASLVRNTPDLDAITEVYTANGKERMVRTDTGAQIKFLTRGERTGRGPSPQVVVFDEALFLTDAQLQAIVPSLSAQSMNADSPQLVFTSSAPLPSSDSVHRVRDAFQAGTLTTGFYAEWGCEPGVDPQDRDAWYGANPSLGIRIGEAWIADQELAIMSPDAFMVERLGVVLGRDSGDTELPEWPACHDGESQMVGAPVVAVDVSPDLAWASIAVAGRRPDRLLHVEVVRHEAGTAWVAETVERMGAKAVSLDPRSPAAGLIPDLLKVGVKVDEVSTLEYLKACASLKQAVADKRLRHRGQQPLNAAVAGAAVRTSGEGWMWARRTSKAVICPLVAVTLAAWGVASVPERTFFVY